MSLGLFSLAAIALSAWLLTRRCKPAGPVDALLFCAPIFTAHILLSGFVLSAMNRLDRLDAWALASGLLLLPVLATDLTAKALRRRRSHAPPAGGQPVRDSHRVPVPVLRRPLQAAFRASGLSSFETMLLVP